jgi:hypothetical protein
VIDGQKQREALSAAERALYLLGRSAWDDAVAAAERACDLDQVDVFATLPRAVALVASEMQNDGNVPAEVWDALAAAVGPGPLQSHVADLSR